MVTSSLCSHSKGSTALSLSGRAERPSVPWGTVACAGTQLVDEGQITPEEALTHPRRSVLMRALSTDHPPEPDLDRIFMALADATRRRILPATGSS